MSHRLGEIEVQILWNRLIAVVEEQAQTLIRTAFSTAAREAGDISAGVFDRRGRMIAQAVTGTPGHVNSMARSVGHFLDAYPLDTLVAGDVLITNDPWKGTGHLFDLTVVTPTFKNGHAVGLFACTTHVVDIGGIGQSPSGRQIYHEGLQIPMMPLARAGQMNEDLLRIVRANVREPVQVVGDIYGLAACNDIGAARLVEMMAEFGLDDLEELSETIISRSRQAMADAIGKLPRGTWTSSMTIDGLEAPVTLVGSLTIDADVVRVDYTGTSGISSFAINCPLCYTEAYTAFGVKCAIAPWIPNNAGTLDAVIVTAPDSCIVNAQHPAAVYARSIIGHMLPDIVFGCLDQAMPGTMPAEGTSSLWNLSLVAAHGLTGRADEVRTAFNVTTFHSGGAGARPQLDGLSATPFPSGVRNVPVEVTESITPVVVWRKELRTDSGGAGRQRGGLGQVMEVSNRDPSPMGIYHRFERVRFPARGRAGGREGAVGRLRLSSGTEFPDKGLHIVPAGDRVIIEMPGGGGYGDPRTRDPRRVARDVAYGLVSAEEAERTYGVAADGAPPKS
ncbi:hydantoinase B/oxoprolinase family protein [Reyranella sp. CPCC 100927]|uniref:hydantoinase B/oxoprolinase family protein n=1 Tax=Reyranella sp. CPCC 100927 TaxID=2599616 RepID=UPI0011B6D6F7|nr:hydantoinase B/oxoprolinase family protein [Reyranella sp. CPCC 100927]TWT05167.1 hydantoinase B/oxoprolinase family protein [Reyranella sp. CPCC 100927]